MFKMLALMVFGVVIAAFGIYALSTLDLRLPEFNFQFPAFNLALTQADLVILGWGIVVGGIVSFGTAFIITRLI